MTCLQEILILKKWHQDGMRVRSDFKRMMQLILETDSMRIDTSKSWGMLKSWKHLRKKKRRIFCSTTLWCSSWNTIAKISLMCVLFEYKLSHNNLALQTGQSLWPRSHLNMQGRWNRCPQRITLSPFFTNVSMQMGQDVDSISGT